MKRKILLTFACFVVLGLVFCTTSYARKVGYINLQRLVSESEMGKAARAEIQKLRKEKEAFLNKKLEEVNCLKNLINKKGAKMDPSEKRSKIQALKKVYKEYQRSSLLIQIMNG